LGGIAGASIFLLLISVAAMAVTGFRIAKIRPPRSRRIAAWQWWAVGTFAAGVLLVARDIATGLIDGSFAGSAAPGDVILVALAFMIPGIWYLIFGATLDLWLKEDEPPPLT